MRPGRINVLFAALVVWNLAALILSAAASRDRSQYAQYRRSTLYTLKSLTENPATSYTLTTYMQRTLLLILCGLCLSFALPAAPIDLVPDSGWQSFSWSGTGPVYNPADGFSITSASLLQVRIVDCCVSGDAFQVYVDSVLALTTPVVADGYFGGVGDSAWGDSNLSQGSFLLGSGTHILTISTYRTAEGYATGGASIRADIVPEPSTWLLLGAGLVAFGAVRRKRA